MAFTIPTIAPGETLVGDEEPDDRRFWSVTTLLGVLDKPGLLYWAAERTAIAAVYQRETWQAMERESGTDEALDWLQSARFRPTKGKMSATERGTLIHAAIETYTVTGVRPEINPALEPWLNSFDDWAQRNSPVYAAAELPVFSLEYGYAGMADCFLELEGVPLIGDYKTAEDLTKRGERTRPYPEVGLQLAAYRNADLGAVWRARRHTGASKRYYLLSEAEELRGVPLPETKGGVVFQVTPNRCEAYSVRCDTEMFEQFLYVQEAARFSFELAKDVIGEVVGR